MFNPSHFAQGRKPLSDTFITRLFVLGFFLMPFCHPAFAQNNKNINWQLSNTLSGVELYHIVTDCAGEKAVLLRFKNTGNAKVEVSWKELFTTQATDPEEGAAGKKSIVLAPGETVEGSCSPIKNKELTVLAHEVNPMYVAEIRRYAFKDITITPIR